MALTLLFALGSQMLSSSVGSLKGLWQQRGRACGAMGIPELMELKRVLRRHVRQRKVIPRSLILRHAAKNMENVQSIREVLTLLEARFDSVSLGSDEIWMRQE